jgi:nitrate reductase beta subunit
MDYIIKIRKLALPLYPQHGTGPNVYYVPPVQVPNGFLEQLFGPAVEEARQLYRNLPKEPKLLGVLLLFGATNRIISGIRSNNR